jgi:peptidyl-prolyl cis-trans isomerase SurA
MRYLSIIFLFSFVFVSCKTTQPPVVQTVVAEPVILTIGNQKITTEELFQSFTKNQFSADTVKQTTLAEYVELYANLKLKVMAAQRQGHDTTAAFREEMESYRQQLAQPYLSDKTLIENLVAEAYQRMGEEVRASHILVPVAAEATPADTLAAYRAALALRGRMEGGESFEELAQRFSKDRATADKGGDLGFFTAFQTVYPFESVAYKMGKGQISMPVRTQSGFHLIKTTDRRPSRGKVQVAHVLVSITANATEEGKLAAKRKIEEAYGHLEQREAFEIVCRDYSDDATTKNNGGVLTQFGTGRMVPIFEEMAFGLANVGDISLPFQTNYGWHILKLLAKKPIESFEELAPVLRQKVTNDSRSELVKEHLSQKLKKGYKVEEQSLTQELAFNQMDSTLLKGTWKYKEPLAANLENKVLFSIDDKPFTVNQFFEYAKNRQEPRPAGSALAEVQKRLYKRFLDKQLTAYEEAHLAKKYPEFRALLTEVSDGVLLSQVMEANVWEPSMTDSLGQLAFYNKNKQKYQQPARATATIITTTSDSLLQRAQESMRTKPYQLRRKGNDLLFDPQTTYLTNKHREALFEVAMVLLRNESYIVEMSAYGGKNESDSVSTARLRNAVKALNSNGIPLVRIVEKDYGKFRPVATLNRNSRVSFQYFSTHKKDLEKSLNALQMGTVNIETGVFVKGANPYIDAVNWKVGNQTLKLNGKNVWVEMSKVEAARVKTFAEARGAVINDFQQQLERDWLAKLRQEFAVKINEEEIKKLVK